MQSLQNILVIAKNLGNGRRVPLITQIGDKFVTNLTAKANAFNDYLV